MWFFFLRIAFLIKIRDTKECLAKPDFIETGQFPEISSTGNSSYVRDIIESQGRLPGQAYRKSSRNYKNKKDKPLSARGKLSQKLPKWTLLRIGQEILTLI